MVSQPYTLEKPNILLAGIWGELKTGKTTLGLTFPKPLLYVDLDLGLDRAIRRFLNDGMSIEKYLAPLSTMDKTKTLPDITVRPYTLPIKWPGAPLSGMLELWNEITQDLFHFFADSRFKSCVIDTGTIMWNLCCDAYLQQVQAEKPNRKQLLQIEYRRPNQEMRALFGGFRTYSKNLAAVHHEGGVYKDQITAGGVESVKVGDSWGGWGEMGKRVDMVVQCYSADYEENGKTHVRPAATILKNGYNLDTENSNLWMPTYDKLLELC